MYCYVKGCSKPMKAEYPNHKVGFCDEHLDKAEKPLLEYVEAVNALKIKLYHKLRNLDKK